MKHVIDAAVPRPFRRSRVVLPTAAVLGLLTLSACATAGGPSGPAPTTDAGATTTASATPTASASPVATTTTSPSPTSTAASDEPFNGQILIVTSEVRDGRLEVSAMVPSVAESGGVCTLTVPLTGARVTTEASEGKDVTYCGLMSLAVSGPTDDLSFTVSYDSSTTKSESSLTKVEPAS